MIVSFISTPLALPLAISSGFAGRLAIPIAAVLSINAAKPVADPSAAISKVVPGCWDLNCSANCGTSFAPSVSEPLITIVSARAMLRLEITAAPNNNTFFMGLSLFDWNKANLIHDLLPNRAQSEIEKGLRHTTRLTIGIVESRPPVRIGMVLDALDRWSGAVD